MIETARSVRSLQCRAVYAVGRMSGVCAARLQAYQFYHLREVVHSKLRDAGQLKMFICGSRAQRGVAASSSCKTKHQLLLAHSPTRFDIQVKDKFQDGNGMSGVFRISNLVFTLSTCRVSHEIRFIVFEIVDPLFSVCCLLAGPGFID